MERLLIATRNPHKVDEIRAMLGGAFACFSLRDVPGAPAVVEDAATFEGNARKKAETLAGWLIRMRSADHRVGGTGCGMRNKPSAECGVRNAEWDQRGGHVEIGLVLADDSGLEVDALDGAPGVWSARFAALDAGGAGNSADAENNAKLLRLLEKVPDGKRTARFRCVLALAAVDPPSATCRANAVIRQAQCFEGVCEGRIGFAPRGGHGFGYDPLFLPAGYEQSFAELGEDIKNRISHRAKALARLKSALV